MLKVYNKLHIYQIYMYCTIFTYCDSMSSGETVIFGALTASQVNFFV